MTTWWRRGTLAAALALSILTAPATHAARTSIAPHAVARLVNHAPAGFLPPEPSCLGARDLLVDHGAPALSGGSYDNLCIVNGSVVTLTSGSVLRAGVVYLDGTSRISADGSPGGRQYGMTDCAGFGNGMTAGSPGGAITILAHEAVMLGRISANGGAGADGNQTPCAAGYVDPGGNGGKGGSIVLKAATLTQRNTIQANGGDGGPGKPAGHGALGGAVVIAVPYPGAAGTPLLSAAAGHNAAAGPRSAPGTVMTRVLSASEQRQLPVAPPPLTLRIGPVPALAPTEPQAIFSAGMQCGAGDLAVASGASLHLHGVHTYKHVCIQGTLLADDQLTLLAQTILIAPNGLISAGGTISRPVPVSPTEPCGPNHDLAQSGAAGAPGAPTFGGPGGKGGRGGAAITLVAGRLLFAGRAFTNGAPGTRGIDGGSGSPSSGDIPPSDGGVGGAGGEVSLVAHELQFTGTLSVRGGVGGQQGNPVSVDSSYQAPFAPRGTAGCARVFADTLRASAGALTIPGAVYYGHTLPVDPVPPPTASGTQYSMATLHTLRPPFLAFWRQHNGLAIFGEPLSEPLIENGQTVQYFERARLVVTGTRVTSTPLGMLLTTGRSFPPVAAFPTTPTDQYFPATGHLLGGRFLTYWQNHDGANLFGPPISEPLMETNGDGSGRRYLVQYFRDARLEYHPELHRTRFEVSLGALGREYLQRKGWL